MKPFEQQTIVEKLRIRAQIRRTAKGRKSVENGEADRLADLLEEAADTIESLENKLEQMDFAAGNEDYWTPERRENGY